MQILLDTHVLLWWLDDNTALNSEARKAIANPESVVHVSSVSLWEIVIKRSIGKLRLPDDWAEVLMEEPFRQLPVTWKHALKVRDLPDVHRDPFDRLLIAQCQSENLVLASHDGVFSQYGIDLLQT